MDSSGGAVGASVGAARVLPCFGDEGSCGLVACSSAVWSEESLAEDVVGVCRLTVIMI